MLRFLVGPGNQRVWQLALLLVLIAVKNSISEYKYNCGVHLLPFPA